LIAIRDPRGVIHALFSYRVDLDLRISQAPLHRRPDGRPCGGVANRCPRSPPPPGMSSAQFGCQMITIEQPFHFPLPSADELSDRRSPQKAGSSRGRHQASVIGVHSAARMRDVRAVVHCPRRPDYGICHGRTE